MGADVKFHRAEICGIPAVWAEGPGPLVGAITFRVGRADEDLRSAGISHLCEHLALHPLGTVSHPFNGLVDDTRTQFWAEGSAEEVSSFLEGVCRNLHALDESRIVPERRVLRAEDQASSGAHPLWTFRFGPQSYGLVGYLEFGLSWLGPEELSAWADERFTRQNAVLWFSGEPPEDLDLELPDGERIRPPEPVTVEGLELPSYVRTGKDGAGVSLLVERSPEMTIGTALLTRGLQEHLRRELGTSYSAGQSYWRLNADMAHVIVGVDGAPGSGREVRDGLLRVYDGFLEHGPSEEELQREIATVERYVDDPRAIPAQLDGRASEELAGGVWMEEEEFAARRAAMTPAAIAEVFRVAGEEAIFAITPGLELPASRATHYDPAPDQERVEGDTLPRDSDDDSVFIIGDDGISQITGREVHTVRFENTLLAIFRGAHELIVLDRWSRSVTLNFRGHELRDRLRRLVGDRLGADRIVQSDPELERRATNAISKLNGGGETWAVALLAAVLFETEELIDLVPARFEAEQGLLALTDARLVFAADNGTSVPFDVAIDQLAGLETTRRIRRGGELSVEFEARRHRFERLPSIARAKELAARIERGLTGSADG